MGPAVGGFSWGREFPGAGRATAGNSKLVGFPVGAGGQGCTRSGRDKRGQPRLDCDPNTGANGTDNSGHGIKLAGTGVPAPPVASARLAASAGRAGWGSRSTATTAPAVRVEPGVLSVPMAVPAALAALAA
ncbi:predicted protein [Mycobacterium tuberculosis T17]|nr:predicted protein [Mycobacterium tuberculosis T17]